MPRRARIGCAWERAGRAPVSGDGNGFRTRYREDFATFAALGLTHHRLSLEWARIEPEPGRVDEAAVAHYRAVLAAARDAGITPWICLHHFTLPQWFASSGGFLSRANRTGAWLAHVERIAERFGDLSEDGSRSTSPMPMRCWAGSAWGSRPGSPTRPPSGSPGGDRARSRGGERGAYADRAPGRVRITACRR